MIELNSIEDLFRRRHFDREVIILCVRWYLCYKVSFRQACVIAGIGLILGSFAATALG